MSSETVDDRDLDIGGWNDPSQQVPQSKKPLWREDPSKSLSDWKIIVEVDDSDEPSEHDSVSIYYTHKCYLAHGKRRSQYFVTQYQLPLQTVEAEKAETLLKLPSLCVPLFPSFLDFVYEGKLDVTKDNVVPLMELARRFGNTALGQKAEAWAQKNLWENIGDCALVMLEHSVQLNAEKVKNASLKIVAENFLSLSEDYLSRLPHEVLLELNLNYLSKSHQRRSAVQEYRFTVLAESVRASSDGAYVSSISSGVGPYFLVGQCAVAEPALSRPVSYWRLEMLKGDAFFGISGTKTLTHDLTMFSTLFGWDKKGVFSKGASSPSACQEWMDLASPRLKEGDAVMMKLDSSTNRLTMKHKRHQKSFEINIDRTDNSTSNQEWYIFVVLKGGNSCLMHGASQKEYEELQF